MAYVVYINNIFKKYIAKKDIKTVLESLEVMKLGSHFGIIYDNNPES